MILCSTTKVLEYVSRVITEERTQNIRTKGVGCCSAVIVELPGDRTMVQSELMRVNDSGSVVLGSLLPAGVP